MNKEIFIKDVIEYLEKRYPISLALDFEQTKIGMSVGDQDIKLQNILLALDVTSEVVEEAIKNDCNLIISHHPFLYNAIEKLLFKAPQTKIIQKLLNYEISLYSMHTNLDVAEGGVNDTLAKVLDFSNIEGENEKASFLRMGTINPSTLIDYAHYVKKTLQLSGVRLVGNKNAVIRKIAVIGGSGGDISNIELAIANNCDCLITGEIKLHVAQYAKARNFALIEVNHGVEQFVLEPLKNDLNANIGLENRIYVSKVNTDPLTIV